MSDRPLGTGKLPNELLREVLKAGRPPPPELKLPPQVGEDAAVLDINAGALIVASDPVTLTGSGVGAHAVVVNANDIPPTNADGTTVMVPNSDLFHLTGIEQEETILLIAPDAFDERQREILFVRETNDHLRTWEGP